jgi:sugar lactone lactonase YvrE
VNGVREHRAEQYSDVVVEHGEGPVWDAAGRRLVLVDMLRGDAVLLDGADIVRRPVGAVAAAVRPRSTGGWVLGVERGFALADPDFHDVAQLPPLWNDDDIRMNDGACDPFGAFLCGSLSVSGRPNRGALYRMTPDRAVRPVLHGITVSNGLGWSADGSRAYFVDSATQRVDEYRYEESGFTARRTLATLDAAGGVPDGLTVDADDGVWVALFGGSAVHRYASDGRLTHRVYLPVAQPTACTFGGTDLATLFVTTSSHGLGPSREPLAGAVFVADVGITGQPVLPFGG